MAEENKSQLISEAELLEAINEDTLVSISLGAGQPQKNVKLSTLASVVAELLPVASIYKKGLMPDSFIGGVSSNQPTSDLDIKTFSTTQYNGEIIGQNGIWVVFTRPCNPYYRIQEAYCLYPFTRAWRAYVDGTWRNWQQY